MTITIEQTCHFDHKLQHVYKNNLRHQLGAFTAAIQPTHPPQLMTAITKEDTKHCHIFLTYDIISERCFKEMLHVTWSQFG